MVIGVALIGVITVALVDAFIAVIITTKEIMRASPRHSRQAFQADRQCGDVATAHASPESPPPLGPVRLPRNLASEGATIEAAAAGAVPPIRPQLAHSSGRPSFRFGS